MMLTSGDKNTTLDPRKVMNVAAEETKIQGQVATAKHAQNTCPRTMLHACQFFSTTPQKRLLT